MHYPGATTYLNIQNHLGLFFSYFFILGETGIGKSTLMNTLFNTTFENEDASHYEQEVKLRSQTYDLQESNVNLRLTIVHSVGFGDQINKDERYRKLINRLVICCMCQ